MHCPRCGSEDICPPDPGELADCNDCGHQFIPVVTKFKPNNWFRFENPGIDDEPNEEELYDE